MTYEEVSALQEKLRSLRREHVDSEFGLIPRSIAHLRACIAYEMNIDVKRTLYSLLLSECSRAGIEAVTVGVLREQLRMLPDDPLSYTGLAHALAEDGEAYDEVFALLRRAVELASEQNCLVRYSLNCQARLALRLLNACVFNQAIGRLIQDSSTIREQDIWCEFDFLDSIPPNFADEEQLNRYRSLKVS